MKTRDIVFYATLAVAALAMAGCEKSNDMPQESGPGHPAEIRFAPAIVPLTRATGTAFEEGDAVGIYCVESTDDPAAAIVGERYIDNKQLTMTAGTLTGTTPCFWPTEYTGPSDFYAYFPYNEKGLSGDKQSYEISVALDQSDDEAFRTSDHMLARAQNTARTEKAIPLDFKRLMSLLDFVLLPGTGYDDVDGILAAEVQVMNMAQVANVDFVTGEVSSPAIKANITPHGSFRASDGKAVGVEAIVPPQHVDTRSYLFNVRIGERNFRCTTDKELTFEAGRRYTFTLTINRAAAGGAVALSPTIEDWTPGTASSEETVEVDPDLDAKVVRDIDGNEYAIVRIGTQQWTVPICARRITTTVLPSPCSKIKKHGRSAKTARKRPTVCTTTTQPTASSTVCSTTGMRRTPENSAPRDGTFRRLKSGRHSPTIWAATPAPC